MQCGGLAATRLLAADTDGSLYAVLVYRLGHGTLPFGPVAILAGQLWAPAIVLLPLAVLSGLALDEGSYVLVNLPFWCRVLYYLGHRLGA